MCHKTKANHLPPFYPSLHSLFLSFLTSCWWTFEYIDYNPGRRDKTPLHLKERKKGLFWV